MALIPVYHVVPSYYAVDPDHDAVSNPIIMGEFVALDTNGYVTQTGVTTLAVGIAGDTIATDSGYSPSAADVVISGTGAVRSTSNRVSDFFNETSGSGKMTVYHGGGEFLTDRYVTGANWAGTSHGANLYTTSAGLLTPADPGSGRVVGRLTGRPSAYPSGVPGTDVQGSISLGDFAKFVLVL